MTPHLWVKDAKSPDDKKKLEETLRASQTLISQLLKIITEAEQNLMIQEVKLEDYDSPAWAYKQANRNGQRTSFKYVRDLLEPLQNR